MKSIIQDFDDLSDGQINTLIDKLNQLKNKRKEENNKFTPTKEQNQILTQLRKILKYNKKIIEEESIETTIYNLENVFHDELYEIESDYDETTGGIESCKDEIKFSKDIIKDHESSISEYNKMLKKVEQRELKFQEAEKLFVKLKKTNKNQ